MTDEPRHLGVDRPPVERRRLVELDDRAVLQHGDAVGDRQRLVLVVRHEDRGRAGLADHLDHLAPHARPELHVDRRERLVEQHELRPRGERPGERDALAFAAGEVMRQPLLEPGEADQLDQLGDARALGRRRVRPAQPERRRSPRPSGAGTARPPAGRSRCGAARAACARATCRRCGRRARSRPRRGARSRRSGAAASSCRCPTRRGSPSASRSRPRARRRRARSASPNDFRRPRRRPRWRRLAAALKPPAPGDPFEPAAGARREAWRRAAARARRARRRRRRSRSCTPRTASRASDAGRVQHQRRGQLGEALRKTRENAGRRAPARAAAASRARAPTAGRARASARPPRARSAPARRRRGRRPAPAGRT